MIVSLCTVCKNRAHHYKQTILKNIQDNGTDGNVEFLLLDYNSDDDLEEWVKEHLMEHIESGVFSYYKTFDPLYFDRSHSRNMAFRLAQGNLVCNVDADNYTGPSFAAYLSQEFSADNDIFLCAGGEHDSISCSDIGGRICVSAKDFVALGGYDEEMRNYGFEDYDLISRLEMTHLKKKLIKNASYLRVINHDIKERITEEFVYKNIKDVSIHYINPSMSKILFLFIDDTFSFGTVINDKNHNSADRSYRFTNNDHHYSIIIAEQNWLKGRMEPSGVNTWKLIPEGSDAVFNLEYDPELDYYHFRSDFDNFQLYVFGKPDLIEEAILFYSETYNRIKMLQNKELGILNPNKVAGGAGVVYKNFNYDNPIIL